MIRCSLIFLRCCTVQPHPQCPIPLLLLLWPPCTYNAPINVKLAGGGRRGIGRDFDRSLWPGGRAFELSCCPGGRDIWIFVRARDHKSFPGWGISVIFDPTFLLGGREFDSNFLETVKIPPYAPPPPPPHPRRLDIDRCRNGSCSFPERARSYRFNHTRSIAEKEKEYTEVTKVTSCMNLRMIQVLIKCFERSTVERIEENSNDLSRCLFIRTIM